MPVVTVKMARGRSIEAKRRRAEEITKVIACVLDVKPEWVNILIEEYAHRAESVPGI